MSFTTSLSLENNAVNFNFLNFFMVTVKLRVKLKLKYWQSILYTICRSRKLRFSKNFIAESQFVTFNRSLFCFIPSDLLFILTLDIPAKDLQCKNTSVCCRKSYFIVSRLWLNAWKVWSAGFNSWSSWAARLVLITKFDWTRLPYGRTLILTFKLLSTNLHAHMGLAFSRTNPRKDMKQMGVS